MKKLLTLILTLALLLGLGAAGAETTEAAALTLTAPGGAPALAVAALAAKNPENFTFVAADTIAAAFAKAEADFIIAPVNAGAKLYRAGKSAYRLAAVVTWGNLYIASQKEGLSEADLKGAEITLFGENTINASVVLYALKENGIEPSKVNYLAGAAETQALLLSNPEAIVVTAEPALTAARIKNDKISAIAVNALYQKATENDGYAQAGLFVNPATLEGRKEAADAYLEQVREAAGLCAADVEAVAAAAVKLEILPNAKVAQAAIPNCAIRYLSAAEAKAQVETTAAVDLSQFGGEVPADDFYYGLEK